MTPIPSSQTSNTFSSVVGHIVALINVILPVLGIAAIMFFFWGLVQYVLRSGDSKGRRQGREAIQWGLVAMLVIFLFWGFIRFLQAALLPSLTGLTPAQEAQQGLSNQGLPLPPQ